MNALNYLRARRRKQTPGASFFSIAFLSFCVLVFTGLNASAVPIVLTPAIATFTGTTNGALSATSVGAVTGVAGLTIAYKQNAGGTEEGSFAGSYRTIFSDTLQNPSAALITFDGNPDPFITGSRIFVYVKDGTPRPWYLFDISSWNGKDTLQLYGFYTGPGAISQISIFSAPNGVVVRSPEGGSTVALLGAALMAIAAVRRKFRA